jgi:hypothetical protein
MYRMFVTAIVAACSLALLVATSSAATTPQAQGSPATLALFEGKLIDLSQGWGAAQACVVYQGAGVVECFRDAAGLQARETQLQTAGVSPATATASCSSPLRLFADGSYGGRELDFYDRGYWQNLDTWGFDNQLSSYRVGGCGVYLADGTYGSGSWYPGNTSAGHSESSMLSGWNDRVSSIYIQ